MCFTTIITEYQTQIIDAVRQIDPNIVIFIEPMWGAASYFRAIDRPGLVYNAHFYEPFYLSGQGFPWIENGNIPTDVNYPGDVVKDILMMDTSNETYDDIWGLPIDGASWKQIITDSRPISEGAEYAFVKIFSSQNPQKIACFDQIEYSKDEGQTWLPIIGGSFEDIGFAMSATDCGFREYVPLHWNSYIEAEGSASRDCTQGFDGNCSLRIQDCSGWCQSTNGNEYGMWGTAGGIPIQSGDTIKLRFYARTEGPNDSRTGIGLMYIKTVREYWDRTTIEDLLIGNIKTFTDAQNAPLFIGEFAPSSQGKRPDSLYYARDIIEIMNDNNISWTFYDYRSPSDPEYHYMSIYNGWAGIPTNQCYQSNDSGCSEDTELLRVIIEHF